MRRSEIGAVGELVGEALAAGGALVKDMHEGIAARAFDAVGQAGAPARLMHDGIASTVYSAVGDGLRGAARGGAALAAARTAHEGQSLHARPRALLVLGALNGLCGNHLAARENELALGMDIRRRGAAVPCEPASLRDAYPNATSRVAVFVHGLCETEAAWALPARGARRTDRRTHGERLRDDLGFTPVDVRYNTDLHVSDNGRRLALLRDAMTSAWPVGVEELVLIGHSMGGLVSRSACHYGALDGLAFTHTVRHVFCLGTPHLGADLEKGANAAAHWLARLPETRALASLLNARSAGIKDLRYGAVVEEDWRDHDPDEFLRDRCREVPFLPDTSYYFVGATLYGGAVGSLLGDLLVRMPSASGGGSGRGRRIPFELDNGHELSGLTHGDLLGHPAVYEQIRRWIVRGSGRPDAVNNPPQALGLDPPRFEPTQDRWIQASG